MIVGYVRISVKENKSLSIINQINLIKNYCINNNYKLDRIFIDDGVSGITYNRKAFNELKEYILNKMVRVIIVKDISRLGRSFFETCYYIEELFSKYNIKLISIEDNYSESIMHIKSLINELYVKDASIKRKNISYLKTVNHEYIGPKAPFGYNIVYIDSKRTLIINEKEASIIRLIFKKFISGNSITSIVNHLNETEDYLNNPHISLWNYKKVRKTLKNALYKGDLIVRKSIKNSYKDKSRKYIRERNYEYINNVFPAIISEDDFLIANSMLKSYQEHDLIKCEKKLRFPVYCSKCKLEMKFYKRFKNNKCQFYYKCINCNKTITFSKLKNLISYNFYLILNEEKLNMIKENTETRLIEYINDKLKLFIESKNNYTLKYKELYKKKCSYDISLELFYKNLDKLNRTYNINDSVIKYLNSFDVRTAISSYSFNIFEINCIKRVEIFDSIKIYYNIKKAFK